MESQCLAVNCYRPMMMMAHNPKAGNTLVMPLILRVSMGGGIRSLAIDLPPMQ